ncbi:MAG TPA: hypothetical protein VKW06_09240 [Candidatus Angelobacter sp.]|nr:hypothetical protein [Candidatus Angelobacter sp.]
MVAMIQPGYEEVFTVTDYWDGPRKGVANFKGLPHFYDSIFDGAKDEYSDLYQLTPISQDVFELVKEDWAIWKRWKSAFDSGMTNLETHPALPQDRPRRHEIRAILDSALQTRTGASTIQRGLFERIGNTVHRKGVRTFQVRWTEVEPS